MLGVRHNKEESVKLSEMEARGSKSLVAGEPMKQPSWLVWTLMKSFRLLLLTVLWTGLGMGVGIVLRNPRRGDCRSAIMHRTPDMSLAYRNISIPVAIFSGSCAFVWNMGRTMQARPPKAAQSTVGARLPGGDGAGYTRESVPTDG